MNDFMTYEHKDSISVITLDDGKVNCCSPSMMTAFNQALDLAEKDDGVILIKGREGKFSAGFDLKVLKEGPEAWKAMAKMGAELAERIFNLKQPVVIACTGHAFAMGAFLMSAATLRIGLDGPFKIGANEVAIGKAVPTYAIEILRHRLSPTYLTRSITTAEMYSPAEAVKAGFLDVLVSTPEELEQTAYEAAERLAGFDLEGYRETLRRLREPLKGPIRQAIEEDYG